MMTHEQRQALIRKPFPIVTIHSVKRWGGVQIIHDETWMEDANAWRKKYAQESAGDDALTFTATRYQHLGGTQ